MQELRPVAIDKQTTRFAIVVSRFNEPVTKKLLDGALLAFAEQGVPGKNISVAWVPGAFELPLVSQVLAEQEVYCAVVALGCVIRGETTHYDYVCESAATGLLSVSLEQQLPIIFGVLTTENREQALARAGGTKGNKGADAALAALEMAGLLAAFTSAESESTG